MTGSWSSFTRLDEKLEAIAAEPKEALGEQPLSFHAWRLTGGMHAIEYLRSGGEQVLELFHASGF